MNRNQWRKISQGKNQMEKVSDECVKQSYQFLIILSGFGESFFFFCGIHGLNYPLMFRLGVFSIEKPSIDWTLSEYQIRWNSIGWSPPPSLWIVKLANISSHLSHQRTELIQLWSIVGSEDAFFTASLSSTVQPTHCSIRHSQTTTFQSRRHRIAFRLTRECSARSACETSNGILIQVDSWNCDSNQIRRNLKSFNQQCD